MKRILIMLLGLTTIFAGVSWGWTAEQDSSERLRNAGAVLNDIMNAPDKGIPEEVLDNAKCIVVVPNLVKGGFIVGGKH